MTLDEMFNLAVQRHQAGQFADAELLYRQILAQNPHHPDALHLMGVLAYQAGQFEPAMKLIQSAIHARHDASAYHCNLGLSLAAAGRYEPAIAAFQTCLVLDPSAHDAVFNLGNVLRRVGRYADAIGAYQRALSLHPDHIGSLINMGSVLRLMGRFDEAVATFNRAIFIDPKNYQAHYNLGNALRELDRIDDAVNAFKQALAASSQNPLAEGNLANALLAQGNIPAAIAGYNRALALKNDPIIASGRLFALQLDAGWDSCALLIEAKKWEEQYAAALPPIPHAPAGEERRLRIGYVSADFRNHVLAVSILPLFREHDRQRFEIICYSSVVRPDAMTDHLLSFVDGVRNIRDLSDDEAAAQIRSDGIDILIDFATHMSGNRLQLFARKPAPVQVTYMGYPGGTGLQAMDWRLSDPFLDPPGESDSHYVEKTFRLASTYWCYEYESMAWEPGGAAPSPPVAPLPAHTNGYITFGCLNNCQKISDLSLELWAAVLLEVPDSKLLILSPPGEARRRMLSSLQEDGVDPARVQFIGRQPFQQFLTTYNQIDITLDTVPYNGHTTSMDSMWMGVPVVTLIGRTVVGRGGLSQLTNLGLKELAAGDHNEFVRIAANLAQDLPRLAELRATLRQRMLASPLTDVKAFARSIEAAYLHMWRHWCAQSR